MSYCDFRLNLFQPFTSMKTKIIPKLSDDWEIVNKSYNARDGMGVKSDKLNQVIQDIPLRRFLRFCKENDVVQIGDKVQGTFAVGQDRSLYTEEMYTKWTDKYSARTETVITVKDAKPGHVYRTVCGSTVIYLGGKYTAKIKDNIEDKKYTKIAKVHYVMSYLDFKDEYPQGVNTKGSLKFIRDMGYALDKDEIDNIFNHYYHNNQDLVYFEDVSFKNPEYGLVETFPITYEEQGYGTNRGKTAEKKYQALMILYNRRYYRTGYRNTTLSNSYEYTSDLKMLGYNRGGYHFSRNDDVVPEKLFRIGLINKRIEK